MSAADLELFTSYLGGYTDAQITDLLASPTFSGEATITGPSTTVNGAAQVLAPTCEANANATVPGSGSFTLAVKDTSGFSSSGNGMIDATQTIIITGAPTGGTFTLTYNGQTTTGIAFNAIPSVVLSALQALSSWPTTGPTPVASGSLPGGLRITFQHAGILMTANGAGLTGGSSPSVSVTGVAGTLSWTNTTSATFTGVTQSPATGGNITALDVFMSLTTLTVASTAGFQSSGFLSVQGVLNPVSYTSTGSVSFYGCLVQGKGATATNGGTVTPTQAPGDGLGTGVGSGIVATSARVINEKAKIDVRDWMEPGDQGIMNALGRAYANYPNLQVYGGDLMIPRGQWSMSLSSPNPVTNVTQSGVTLASNHTGRVRIVGDGVNQTLLMTTKDCCGLWSAGGGASYLGTLFGIADLTLDGTQANNVSYQGGVLVQANARKLSITHCDIDRVNVVNLGSPTGSNLRTCVNMSCNLHPEDAGTSTTTFSGVPSGWYVMQDINVRDCEWGLTGGGGTNGVVILAFSNVDQMLGAAYKYVTPVLAQCLIDRILLDNIKWDAYPGGNPTGNGPGVAAQLTGDGVSGHQIVRNLWGHGCDDNTFEFDSPTDLHVIDCVNVDSWNPGLMLANNYGNTPALALAGLEINDPDAASVHVENFKSYRINSTGGSNPAGICMNARYNSVLPRIILRGCVLVNECNPIIGAQPLQLSGRIRSLEGDVKIVEKGFAATQSTGTYSVQAVKLEPAGRHTRIKLDIEHEIDGSIQFHANNDTYQHQVLTLSSAPSTDHDIRVTSRSNLTTIPLSFTGTNAKLQVASMLGAGAAGQSDTFSGSNHTTTTTLLGSVAFPQSQVFVNYPYNFPQAGNVAITGVTGDVSFTGVQGSFTATSGAGQIPSVTGTLNVVSTSGFVTPGYITVPGVTGSVHASGINSSTQFAIDVAGSGTASNNGVVQQGVLLNAAGGSGTPSDLATVTHQTAVLGTDYQQDTPNALASTVIGAGTTGTYNGTSCAQVAPGGDSSVIEAATLRRNVWLQCNQSTLFAQIGPQQDTAVSCGFQPGTTLQGFFGGVFAKWVESNTLSPPNTTVNGGSQSISSSGGSTLNVGSTTGFSNAGTIFVPGVGFVTYTGTSGGNSFTGCTAQLPGVTANAIASAPVWQEVNSYAYACVYDNGSNSIFAIIVVVNGTHTVRATTTLGGRIANGTAFQVRLKQQANLLTADYFTSGGVPSFSSAGASTLTYTLAAGSEDNAIGDGILGYGGNIWCPADPAAYMTNMAWKQMNVCKGNVQVRILDAQGGWTQVNGFNFANDMSSQRFGPGTPYTTSSVPNSASRLSLVDSDWSGFEASSAGTIQEITYPSSAGAAADIRPFLSVERGKWVNLPADASASVTGSGSAIINFNPYSVMAYLYGGSVSVIKHQVPGVGSGFQVGTTTPAAVLLAPGEAVIPTYSASPTVAFVPKP